MDQLTPEGPLLCIDTSIPVGSVAVVDPAEPTGARVRTGSNARAEKLFVEIESLLAECGLAPGDLAGVAVAAGPGSFTGLRIAASTAKTLAWTLGIPLFAAGSLLCQANRASDSGLPVCAAFDAGRGEFYAACYRWKGRQSEPAELLAPGAWDIESLCRLLDSLAEEGGLVLLGQGYLNNREQLDERLGDKIKPVDEALHAPDASALGRLVLAAPGNYLVREVSIFEPDYIRVGQAGLRLSQ
jgi:tRNA threonylcarbamoyladenosine biosynthesis protein TsaB